MTGTGAGAPSELRLRVLSAFEFGGLALTSAWVGSWLLVIVWLLAALVVVREWGDMARIAPRIPAVITAGVGIAAVQLSWIFATPVIFAGIVLAAFVCVLVVARTPRDKGWAVLGLSYAIPIALVPVALRFHDPAGMWALLWMFAVVWMTDSVAYFVGRAVGGPKLWPAVSPKKTWSGFVGGLVGAVLAGTAVAAFAQSKGALEFLDLLIIAFLSALASVVSQGGDLAESAMKRHFGVKDSGTLIPGHGGFMDRLDGFAAVAILLCLLLPLAKLSLWTVAP